VNVLIITHSEDNESISFVSKALEQRGAKVIRLNTDMLPCHATLSITMQHGHTGLEFVDEHGKHHNLQEVSSIWYRRMRSPQLPDLDAQIKEVSSNEAKASVLGLLGILDKQAYILNPPHLIRYAEHKPMQLELARSLGLEIPRTLITSSATSAKTFYEQCSGKVVTKMMTTFAIYEQGLEKVVFTTPLSKAHIEQLDGLRYCPMIFQEMIPKALELRVTIVGNQVFSAAMDSQKSDLARFDWREDGEGLLNAWEPYTLPQAIQSKLLALMDSLGLDYGAADLILTPDGRYVFLELNPAGEFFWLEVQPGLAISTAIAEVLVGKTIRRRKSKSHTSYYS
jgi:glutathione synthase/RimK-type ligase-like ATP-grasp enzyme